MPLFENRVPVVLTLYCLVFLKACQKLDDMTHFGFHGNCFKCFKLAQRYFSTKTSNTTHSTNGNSLVFNKNARTKIALCTYLRLTLNGNYVGWTKVRVLREYSIARANPQNRQSW